MKLIGSPESAAYREGFITADDVRALAAEPDVDKSGYGEQLLRILEFQD